MNILVDIRHLTHAEQTGVGRYTSNLLTALLNQSPNDTYTLLSTGKTTPNLASDLTAQTKHIHINTPNKLLTAQMIIKRSPSLSQLAKTTPDLLWLPNLAICPTPTIPYVLTIHDLSWKLMPEYYSRKMQLWHKATRAERLIKKASALIVPSECTKMDLQKLFSVSNERIHVIPHGRPVSFTPKQQATDHGTRGRLHLPKRFALFVGTLEPRKNVLSIIEGMAKYRNETGDTLPLVLVGRYGWKSSVLQKRIRETPWIKQIGYVSEKDLPAIYRSAEVFLWPSVYEGFGMPPLEALCCGVPVITSAISSLPEVVGNAAILVDPYNPQDLTTALTQLKTSPSLRTNLIKLGLRQAETFDWNRSATLTRTLFQDMQK